MDAFERHRLTIMLLPLSLDWAWIKSSPKPSGRMAVMDGTRQRSHQISTRTGLASMTGPIGCCREKHSVILAMRVANPRGASVKSGNMLFKPVYGVCKHRCVDNVSCGAAV